MSKTAQALASIFKFSTTVTHLDDFDYDEPVDADILTEFAEPLFPTWNRPGVAAQQSTGTGETEYALQGINGRLDAVDARTRENDYELEDDADEVSATGSWRRTKMSVSAERNRTASSFKSRRKLVFSDEEDEEDSVKLGALGDGNVEKTLSSHANENETSFPCALKSFGEHQSDLPPSENVREEISNSTSRRKVIFYDDDDDSNAVDADDSVKVPATKRGSKVKRRAKISSRAHLIKQPDVVEDATSNDAVPRKKANRKLKKKTAIKQSEVVESGEESNDADDNYKVSTIDSLAALADMESDDEQTPGAKKQRVAQNKKARGKQLETAQTAELSEDPADQRIEEIDALLKIFDDHHLAVDAEADDNRGDLDYEAYNASGRKAHRPKGAARKSKTVAQEMMRAKLEMQAETQRIEREMALRLPCYEPPTVDLDAFLKADRSDEALPVTQPLHRYGAQVANKELNGKMSFLEYKRQSKARIREWHENFLKAFGNNADGADEIDADEEETEVEVENPKTTDSADAVDSSKAEETAPRAEGEAAVPPQSNGPDLVAGVGTFCSIEDEVLRCVPIVKPVEDDTGVKQFMDEEAAVDDDNDEADEAENDADDDDADSFINDDDTDDEPFVFPHALPVVQNELAAVDGDSNMGAEKSNDDEAPVGMPRKRARQHVAFDDDDDASDEDEADGEEDEEDEDDTETMQDDEAEVAVAAETAADEELNDQTTGEKVAVAVPAPKARKMDGFIDDEAELSDDDNYQAGSDDERDDQEKHYTEEEIKELEAMIDRDFSVSNDELYAQIMPLLKKQDEQLHRRLLRKLRDQLVEDEDLYLTSEEDLQTRKQRSFKWTSLLDAEEIVPVRGGQNLATAALSVEDEDARIQADIKLARDRFEQRRHNSTSVNDVHVVSSSAAMRSARGGLLHRTSRFATGGTDDRSSNGLPVPPRFRNNRVIDADEEDDDYKLSKAAELKAVELERRFNTADGVTVRVDAGLLRRRSTKVSFLAIQNNIKVVEAKSSSAPRNMVGFGKSSNVPKTKASAKTANDSNDMLLNTPERSSKFARGSWLARNTNSLHRLHSVKFADAPNYELGLFQYISPQRNAPPTISLADNTGPKNKRKSNIASAQRGETAPKTPQSKFKRARLVTPGKKSNLSALSPHTTPNNQMSIAKLLMAKHKSGLDEFSPS